MKIPLNLNGEQTVLDANPGAPLLGELRKKGLFSVKCGCDEGKCGNCMVLFNGKPVPSCKVKMGLVRDNSVVTLEFFSAFQKKNSALKKESKNRKTSTANDSLFDEEDFFIYKDILSSFLESGIHLCGYCNAGKIFTAYYILKNNPRPSSEFIMDSIKDLNYCCTDSLSLVKGILKAASLKNAREEKKLSVQK